MTHDQSAGWEAVTSTFAGIRSGVGADVVARWSAHLSPGGAIVDIGCGTGVPISRTLADQGFDIWGIDASSTLLAAFRQNIPGAKAVCEAAETSRLFDRQFDGAVAIGLLFLLPEAGQCAVIGRVAQALRPGGHFLFSAPLEVCEWVDTLTRRRSLSLGEERYRQLLADAGLHVVDSHIDEGSNHYIHAVSGLAASG